MARSRLKVVILFGLTFTSVALAESISSSRAHDLATAYMMQHVSLCGVVGEPVSHGTYWELPIRIDQGAEPAGAIRVDKKTGSVSYPDRPIATPESLAAWEKSIEKQHK